MPKSIIALILAGLSIGGIFFIYTFQTKGGNFYEALVTSTELASPDDITEDVAEGEDELESNQSSFGFNVNSVKPGKTVLINLLNISLPTFVVVYSDNESNFGDRLGMSKSLKPGFYTDFQIELSRDVSSGETLHIALYSDDGNGEFGDIGDILVKEGQYTNAIRDVVVTD